MSKYCMTCGLLNENHKSDHPTECISLLKATITKLTAALIYYADNPDHPYGNVARAALKESDDE